VWSACDDCGSESVKYVLASDYERDVLALETERDQLAADNKRLRGLLMRVQVSMSLDDTEWGYSGAEKYKLLTDIRAALASGKEADDAEG
jgi:hypothetical protein